MKNVNRSFRHQRVPGTPQRFAQSQHRRQQDVDVAGLDLLNCANVQIDQFSQFFLGDFPAHPLAAEIDAESLDLRGLLGVESHTPY